MTPLTFSAICMPRPGHSAQENLFRSGGKNEGERQMNLVKLLFLIFVVGSLVVIATTPRVSLHQNDNVVEMVANNPTDLDKRCAGAIALSLVAILLISLVQAYKKRELVQENIKLRDWRASTDYMLNKSGRTGREIEQVMEGLKEESPAHKVGELKLSLADQLARTEQFEKANLGHDEQMRQVEELVARQEEIKNRVNRLQEARRLRDQALSDADNVDDEIRKGLSNLEDEGDNDAKAKYNRINGYFADHKASIEAAEKLMGPAEELKAKFEALKARAVALDDNDTGIYGAFQAIDALKKEIGDLLDNIEEDSEGNSLEDNIRTYRKDLEGLAERINDASDARDSLLELLAEVTKLVKPEDEATPPESEGKKA